MVALSKIAMAIPVSLALGLANTPAHAQDAAATERLAHDAYVAVINSNDVDIATDRANGKVSIDTGKGINIFHHDADGK